VTIKPGTTRATGSPLAASIDRVRVVSDTRLRISLRPAALGELRIELAMAGSALRARVRTATQEARTLILARLEELRDILEGQGIRVKEFQVEVDSSGTAPEPDAGGRKRRREEDRSEGGPRSHRRQVLDVRV
jgi:flagellar hook-length control protein FliK